MTDDDLLVRRARRGERAAVEELLRSHHAMIRAVCHRMVIDRHDAEDATQNALIAVVRALPSFDGRSKFSTWVYRIATNAALDEIRRLRRRPLPVDEASLASSPVADGSGAIDAQMVVRAALARLPEEFRVAMVLRHVADLDYAEIAEILGVPVGTVRSRLSRGREQLQELLGNQFPSGGVT